MNTIARWLKACWNAYAAAFSWLAGGLLSNRGLAILLLAASVALITGPWLRSSVSRDFRGVHIPWADASTDRFLPEYASQAPRAWRADSIAVPLLVVVAAGALVTLVRPRWTSHVFGLLLAGSIAALAVTLWNHPGLFEFFESEVRGRRMLRTVFSAQTDDMMTVRAADRLQTFGGTLGKTDLLEPTHPLLAPFQYWMYGPWLVAAALVGVLATRHAPWPRRFAAAAAWTACGLLLAAAATWPRWLAEYHWARAETFENQHQFAEADRALEQARAAMPSLGYLRRYWHARGRLDYRQRRAGEYYAYFIASQHRDAGDRERARAELEPYIHADASTAQRDLFAEIIGAGAAHFASEGQHGAAEIAWAEAATVAPWKPAYWVAEAVTILTANPARAHEVEDRYYEQLAEIGDCFVGCDFASALGDAYFESGDFERARLMYARAMDLFHLPKYVNLHAQEGRLGM